MVLEDLGLWEIETFCTSCYVTVGWFDGIKPLGLSSNLVSVMTCRIQIVPSPPPTPAPPPASISGSGDSGGGSGVSDQWQYDWSQLLWDSWSEQSHTTESSAVSDSSVRPNGCLRWFLLPWLRLRPEYAEKLLKFSQEPSSLPSELNEDHSHFSSQAGRE